MKQFQAISESNQPQPFVPILGWDDEDEVHEYYYANGAFHTPDGLKTNRLVLMWADMPHPDYIEEDNYEE